MAGVAGVAGGRWPVYGRWTVASGRWPVSVSGGRWPWPAGKQKKFIVLGFNDMSASES